MSDDVRTVRRNGSEINAVMHAAKALGAESVPISGETVVMSEDRVALLAATPLDDDLMGQPSAEYADCAVPVKGWIDLPDGEVEVSVSGGIIAFAGFERAHHVLLTEASKRPKIPYTRLEIATNVEAKRLRNAVKLLKSLSDHVTLTATHGVLYMSAKNGTTEVVTPLCDCIHEGTSKYPMEHVDRISKVLDGWVRILFSPDSPMSLEWVVGDLLLMWMVAPRIDPSGGE